MSINFTVVRSEDPLDETIDAFEELKAEGLIRYYGISSIRPNVIHEYTSKADIVSVMMQYNILDRRPEEEDHSSFGRTWHQRGHSRFTCKRTPN